MFIDKKIDILIIHRYSVAFASDLFFYQGLFLDSYPLGRTKINEDTEINGNTGNYI